MGYSEDKNLLSIVSRWKKIEMFGTYFKRDGDIGRSFLFPSNIYNRIAKIMGLPAKSKSKGRVRAGKYISRQNFTKNEEPLSKVA